jgi:hypothetical protein
LRVAYPNGFFAEGIDGPIDDAKAGRKGRRLRVTSGNRTPFHIAAIDAPAPAAPGKTKDTLPSLVGRQLPAAPRPAGVLTGMGGVVGRAHTSRR